jgi:S1-C subfamily serine protease
MKKHFIKTILTVGFCSSLIIGTIQLPAANVVSQLLAQENQLSQQELEKKAQKISVKILIGETLWGTGVLIKKDANTYTVATNAHVLLQIKPPYRLQTPDGNIHQAKLLAKFDRTDLALLQFNTNQNYPIALLKPAFTLASLVNNAEVFAAGYPVEASKGFVVKRGKVAVLLPQAMTDGYQIGFSADLEQGMSGGALLNLEGEVVGIIGRSSYPPNGYPRAYQFDNLPTNLFPEQLMLNSSWAIPIEILASRSESKLSQDLAWNIPSAPTNPSPNLPTSFEQPKPIVARSTNGKVKAQLSYENGIFSLAINRETQQQIEKIKLEESILDKNVQIEDLDNDREPEVIVNFKINNSCPGDTISYFYNYQNNYSNSVSWKNRGFLIKDIDRNSQLEIQTFDENFACQFTTKYQTQEQVEALPIKIWKYKDGKLEDVTRQDNYLQTHEDHAKKIYEYYKQNDWQNRRDELQAVLAAYLASKYLVGQGQDGWQNLQRFYSFKDKENYFAKLKNVLEANELKN